MGGPSAKQGKGRAPEGGPCLACLARRVKKQIYRLVRNYGVQLPGSLARPGAMARTCPACPRAGNTLTPHKRADPVPRVDAPVSLMTTRERSTQRRLSSAGDRPGCAVGRTKGAKESSILLCGAGADCAAGLRQRFFGAKQSGVFRLNFLVHNHGCALPHSGLCPSSPPASLT